MPRVENLGKNVDEWYEEYEEGTSTHDVCASCWADLQAVPDAYNDKLTPYNGDPQGDEGWGGEVCHPSYNEDDYDCEVCGDHLTEDDD
jgi:hypothetical protein